MPKLSWFPTRSLSARHMEYDGDYILQIILLYHFLYYFIRDIQIRFMGPGELCYYMLQSLLIFTVGVAEALVPTPTGIVNTCMTVLMNNGNNQLILLFQLLKLGE